LSTILKGAAESKFNHWNLVHCWSGRMLCSPCRSAVELVKGQNGVAIEKHTSLKDHMPLDHLLISASKVLKANLLAVLLSGGSEQGIDGFRAVRREGGITLAEDLLPAQIRKWQKLP